MFNIFVNEQATVAEYVMIESYRSNSNPLLGGTLNAGSWWCSIFELCV